MYSVELIRKFLLLGRQVYTNLAVLPEEFAKQGLPVDHLHVLPKEFSEWESTIETATEGRDNLVLVDEAGKYFFVGKRSNAETKEALYMLIKYSRHKGLAIWFCEQNFDNLDVQCRRMAQFRFHCTAVKEMPLIGPLMVTFRGDFKRGIYNPNKNAEINATYHRFNPKLAVLYKTDSEADPDKQKPAGVVVRQRAPMTFASWLFLGLFTLAPCGLIYAALSFYGDLTGKEKAHPSETDKHSEHVRPANDAAPTVQALAKNVSQAFVPADPYAEQQPVLTEVEIFGHPVRSDRMHSLHFVEFGTMNLHTSAGVVTPDGLIDGFPVVSIQRHGPQAFMVLDAQPAWHFVRTVNKPIEPKTWNTSSPNSAWPSADTSPSGRSAYPPVLSQTSSANRGAQATQTTSTIKPNSRYATREEYQNASDKTTFEDRGTDIINKKEYYSKQP